MNRLNEYKITFANRLLAVCVNDAAGQSEKAFINIMPAGLWITTPEKDKFLVTSPTLFISDGMSIPDIAQSKMQGEEGINAGHWHDMLYSKNCGFLEKIKIEIELASKDKDGNLTKTLNTNDMRKLADYILEQYIIQHCSGFSDREAGQVKFAVKLFGKKHFQNAKVDEWRGRVFKRLFPKSTDRFPQGTGVYFTDLTDNERENYFASVIDHLGSPPIRYKDKE